MMHRFQILLAAAAITATGCQVSQPAATQFSLAAEQLATQRLLADTQVSFSTNVTTLAGTGVAGFMEGPAATARFNSPKGIAVDPAGTVYVADSFNMGVRAIAPTGLVMTVGFPAALGKIVLPTAVAVTPMGVAVLEAPKNRIQFLSPAGVITPFVGGGVASQGNGMLPGTYGYADGRGEYARFQTMGDMCVDSAGRFYITDSNRVRMALPDGSVTTLAGIDRVGHVNGPGSQSRFNTVKGVAADNKGHIYVVDSGNHRIRRLTQSATDPSSVTVDTIAGSDAGYQDGTSPNGVRFKNPTDIAVDAIGNLYVTDTGNHRIRKILTDGSVITLAGNGQEGSTDGAGLGASFKNPGHIAVDAAGNVYVTDTGNHKVRKIQQL